MYFLTDICFMCLKNNIKLQSVFIQDNDGIFFNEKLKCCFPEIINSVPDEHKLACSECLERLRFLYDFKQCGIRNNTVVNNYLGKLKCENKSRQQPAVVLPARKRRKKVSTTPDLAKIKVENNWKNKNVNLITANGEKLNKINNSYQSMATEKINLENKNVEKVCPFTNTENIYTKQEPQFSEDDSTTSYLDKQADDLEGSNSSNENDSNFEMSEEGTCKSTDYNNQNVTAIPLKPFHVSNDSVKFCNTCQELLFKDLNNINLHLYTHIQSSNCSRCEDSLEEINKFQRHMFNHCETMVEIIDKGEQDEKFSCALCGQQFDKFSNLKKHILDKHITSLKCVVCSRVFTTKPSLHRHILVSHCHVKLYKCKLCSTRFSTKESIKNHIVFKHYSKVCVCKFCQRTFRHSKALREHISKFHYADLRLEEEEDTTHDSSKRGYVGDRLSCGICHKQFDDLDNLKKHIYAEHMRSTNCEICARSYTRQDTLHRHILEQHCDVKLFKCIICFMQFADKESVKIHVNQQHNVGNTITEPEKKAFPVIVLNKEKLSCVICKKQFDSFQRLKQHIYDDHMTGLNCAICSKTFSRRIFLNRHIMELHCQLRIIHCKLCPQRFACKESFKDHIDQQHSSGVNGAVTKLDNKVSEVTESEVVLKKDEAEYSNEYYSSDEEIEADEIRKDFSNFAMAEKSNSRTSNSSNLEESVGSSVIPTATTTTVASYCEPGAPVDQSDVCDICQKMFLYLSNLSEHLNAHMQESSCSMCKDSAENISRLQRHMLTPCGNTNTPQDSASAADTRTNEKVTCVVCQQDFNFNVLKKHMYTHIKNLTCMICNVTFTRRPVLCRHLVYHCNLKKFQCELCDKKYTKKDNLKQHVDSKHSSKVVVCQHCQKTIKCPKTLREHIIKQHPDDTYRCEVCKRSFLHKNELKKHAEIHTFL